MGKKSEKHIHRTPYCVKLQGMYGDNQAIFFFKHKTRAFEFIDDVSLIVNHSYKCCHPKE